MIARGRLTLYKSKCRKCPKIRDKLALTYRAFDNVREMRYGVRAR